MKRLLVFLILLPFSVLADDYPKNPNIDVRHYAFEITLSDDTDEISMQATITFRFLSAGIDKVRLDLINKSDQLDGKGMTVATVTHGSQSLNFTHQDDVLWIDLPHASSKDEEIQIKIAYKGIPAAGLKIAPNKHGDRTFFSDNWPNKARNWLSTVDHPYDKATSEFIVTAPDKYEVVSNGLLAEETSLGNGKKITHWKQSVPISCWLYVLGVAEFAVQYVDEFDGKSIQTWVYHQDRDAGFYDFAVPTKRALEFYSDYVGPFAYEKLANIQSNSVGGGMEAASAILYGDNSVTGDRSVRWRNVVIHEIAHQWFGNSVTEYDWDDVWLSEGITTYFTLLFIEHAYGRDEFVAGLKSARKWVLDFYDKNPDYRIVHDNLTDMNKVTTGNTYQKGAWIMHMLRQEMGDEAFEGGIKEYYHTFFNSNASTKDLRGIMEKWHGESLEQFFQQWLYQGGNIVLDASWSISKSNELQVDVRQIQKDYDFVFPLTIGVYYEGQETPELFQVQMTDKTYRFKSKLEKSPTRVVLDPNTQLLARWTLTKK